MSSKVGAKKVCIGFVPELFVRAQIIMAAKEFLAAEVYTFHLYCFRHQCRCLSGRDQPDAILGL